MTADATLQYASRVWRVACWEFKRFYKWRGETLAIAITFIATAAMLWLGSDRPSSTRLIGWADPQSAFTEVPPPLGNFQWLPVSPESAPREALESLDLDGLIIWRTAWAADLYMERDVRWINDLQAVLLSPLVAARTEALGLPEEDVGELLEPLSFDRHAIRDSGETSTQRVSAFLLVAFLALGAFTSMAYQFSAITGEKQARITELIVSAIGPQAWIDGKLLGVTLLSLQGVFGQCLAVFAGYHLGHALSDTPAQPLSALSTFAALLPLGLLGLLFWNAILAALAATIDDPQTSSRSSVMLLPALVIGSPLVFLGELGDWPARLLSWFPPTAPAALAARFGMGAAPWIDMALGSVILALCTWYIRRAAGRVFAASILLYGTEPSWGQVWRHALRRTS